MRRLTLVAHAAFIPTGVVTVFLGPLLPILSSHWGLDDAQAGYLFTVQFAASTVGVALSSWLAARSGFRLPIIIGLVTMSLGTTRLLATTWPFGVLCVLCSGIGLGFTIPAANLLVAVTTGERRAGALNLLNFSWSVGTVACPFLIAAFQRSHQMSLFLCCLGGVLILVSLLISTTSLSSTEQKPILRKGSSEPAIDIWKNRYVLMLGVLFLLYVGTENAIGGWRAA